MKGFISKITNSSFFQDFKKSCKQIKNNNIISDSERENILKKYIKLDNNYSDAIVSKNFYRDLEFFSDYNNEINKKSY